ncbi:hypothetical protein MTDSW087_04955 [Methylobacterium dankookense]|uniref:Uncharacterized protein n=1 Tax=Methylobacterium dankookense TaxID=560405 RepID=A0A564G3Z6_9HYPH|nr:hypothetical protein IFDJLNFL_1085 [Methylobacterium dankookense]VUF15219.1 hypothetical protein MTDSW087_04955 [Methylobacterium dankookense]
MKEVWRPRPFFQMDARSMACDFQTPPEAPCNHMAFEPPPNPGRGVEPRKLSNLMFRMERVFSRSRDGWGPRDIAADFPDLVAGFASGRIAVRIVRLPYEVCERASLEKPELCGTEGLQHARMKLAAEAWMRGEGASDARTEVRCLVGRADAFSPSQNWVVEVGNTPLRKLFVCVDHPTPHRFSLIPFQRAHWQDRSVRRLLALDFAWDPSLTREIDERRRARAWACVAGLELDPQFTSAAYKAALKFPCPAAGA